MRDLEMRDWRESSKQPRRYVLLDRVGVINRRLEGGYVTYWKIFHFIPRALVALRLLTETGDETLVISNQACVGKGLLTSDELDSITRKFLLDVALFGGRIAQVYYCRHREEDNCTCRKPLPGMIVSAKLEHGFVPAHTYVIGDSQNDLAAATAAGCPSILIQSGTISLQDTLRNEQQLAAPDLCGAVELMLALDSPQIPEHAIASNYRHRT